MVEQYRGQRNNRQWREPKLFVTVQDDEITYLEPDPEDGSRFQITISANVTKGNRPNRGASVQFYIGGIPMGELQQTNENGKAINILRFSSKAHSVTIEAMATDANLSERSVKKIALPQPEKKPEKKSEPFEMIVVPRRIGNRIILYIRVNDEEDRGVKNAKITIIDSSQKDPLTVNADEDGEYLYKFKLRANEERETCINTAGYGDREFRRTFRGRRIK